MSRILHLALGPLLLAQGVWTRRRTPRLPEADGPREGVEGEGADPGAAPPLRVLIVGDSSAAGVGVDHQRQALAGQLAKPLAALARRHVAWRLVARSGVTSEQALALLRIAPVWRCDLALVVLGVNDVLEQVPTVRTTAAREAINHWLVHRCGARHVVHAALPRMDCFPALPQPLRAVAGREARRHDRAVSAWASGRPDASHVPLDLVLEPSHMARDGFHPGEEGYRHCGRSLAASLHRLAADIPVPPSVAKTKKPPQETTT